MKKVVMFSFYVIASSLLYSPIGLSAEIDPTTVVVFYNRGESLSSIGVVNGELLEAGDIYAGYSIEQFMPDSILFQHTSSRHKIVIPARGILSRSDYLWKRARYYFVMKQLRKIHEAQSLYRAHTGHHSYGESLEVLIQYEFLNGGFTGGVKQEYHFKIAETGHQDNGSISYLAIAAPVLTLQPDYFFAVDESGEVRFAGSEYTAPWGPVWNYSDTSGGPKVDSNQGELLVDFYL